MNKKNELNKYFDQKKKLNLKNKLYFNSVKRILSDSLADDLNNKGDITTNLIIKKNINAKAIIIAKQDGILAGLEEIKWLLKKYKIQDIRHKNDGEHIKYGQKILTISGGIKDILKIERTILNTLQRMSGIATETDKLLKKTKNKILICSTRKTPLGILDKKAVVIGGGGTHRLGLYDWILIKNNHIKFCGKNLKPHALGLRSFYEIEVKNKNEAIKAIELKPSAIMFDNMKPKEIKDILKIIKNKDIIFEASGGINEKNIVEYSKTGVDIISLGYLTHSCKALDLSLNIK